MTDLVEFIEARLAEDERLARRAGALCGCHPPALSWQFGEGATDGRIVAEGDGHPDVRPRGRLARRWSTSYNDMFAAEHIVRHDPARVLREVEAKRRLIADHAIPADRWPDDPYHQQRRDVDQSCAGCGANYREEPMVEDINDCPVLRAVAAVWSDHGGYRPEWSTT